MPEQFSPRPRVWGLTLILEPGRVIAGNAGILLCRVIRRKTHGKKRFVIVDAGMNDLIRPALYASFHRVMPVRPREGKEIVDVVGPICESADFIAQDRELDRLESGDLVAVMTAGAYGFSLASNYNSRPRPAEVLVDGDSFSVVRPSRNLRRFDPLRKVEAKTNAMNRLGSGL